MRTFGMVGLGVMGRNLALNARDHGIRVVGFDREPAARAAFVEASAGQAVASLEQLVAGLAPPRVVLLSLPEAVVDDALAELRPLLAPGDVVVDSGNSHYRDTARREGELAEARIALVGLGVSGGSEGARHGPALMAGGEAGSVTRVLELLRPLAAQAEGRPCVGVFGPAPSGHFVKMAHNGIEYADMQMIAEAYWLLRSLGGLSPAAIANVFTSWNEGPLGSFLMEVSSGVLSTVDADSAEPMVDVIVDAAGQKGTGHWAVTAAMELGVPVPSIAAAVDARNLTAARALRAATAFGAERVPIQHADVLAEVHDALVAGRVCAFAQGLALLEAARRAHGWPLDLAEATATWRGGCIIRGKILDEIASAFTRDAKSPHVLALRPLAALLEQVGPGLRRAVGEAVRCAVPVPALASALAYRDALASERLWADLIQGQRDCFGAHGFERVDRLGTHHGPWKAPR